MKKVDIIDAMYAKHGVQDMYESLEEIIKLFPNVKKSHLIELNAVVKIYGNNLVGYVKQCNFTEENPVFIHLVNPLDNFEILIIDN